MIVLGPERLLGVVPGGRLRPRFPVELLPYAHETPPVNGREGWAADFGGGNVAAVSLCVVYWMLEVRIRPSFCHAHLPLNAVHSRALAWGPGVADWLGFSAGQTMTEPKLATGDALLVIDVINDFRHDDGDRLLASFRERLVAMTETIAKARAAAVPIIYVNEDHDRWDSDAPALTRSVLDRNHGSEVVKSLAPHPDDHFLLKHRYSAFDHTALDLLLEQLSVDRLVLIGSAIEGCIVQTAIDAREQGFKTTILADACASTDPELEKTALNYAEQVVGATSHLVNNVRLHPGRW